MAEVESYIPGAASLNPFQRDLEKALYWHGASLGVSTSVLNVPGHHARWYASLWGARSQMALTNTILSLSDAACLSLTTQGVFAADRLWLTAYAGASTVARVIRTFQDLDADVYQVTPEEDARHRFDLLLARADWPASVAVQVKSGHEDRHDFRMIDLAQRSARAMRIGIEALQQETAFSWKAAECIVGRVGRGRSKAIAPLPCLRELLLQSHAELFLVPVSA